MAFFTKSGLSHVVLADITGTPLAGFPVTDASGFDMLSTVNTSIQASNTSLSSLVSDTSLNLGQNTLIKDEMIDVNANLDSLETKTDTINSNLIITNASLSSLATKLDTVITNQGNTNQIKDKFDDGKCYFGSICSKTYSSNSEMFYLTNPSASLKTMYIYRLSIHGGWGTRKITMSYYDTEFSGGSTSNTHWETSIPYNYPDNSNSSVSVLETGSTTATGTETVMNMFRISQGTVFELLSNSEIIELPPDSTIMMTTSDSQSNARSSVNIHWYEE